MPLNSEGGFMTYNLNESPTDIEYLETDGLDIPSENKAYLEIAKKSEFLGDYVIGGQKFKTYMKIEPGNTGFQYGMSFKSRVSYFFLNEDETEVLAQHSFKEMDIGGKPAIQNSLTWKSKKIKGFMKEWFSKYIIPKYDIILSDMSVSKHAVEFWKWMFINFVPSKGKMFIFDSDNKQNYVSIKNNSDFEKYRGWGHFKKLYAFYKK